VWPLPASCLFLTLLFQKEVDEIEPSNTLDILATGRIHPSFIPTSIPAQSRIALPHPSLYHAGGWRYRLPDPSGSVAQLGIL